MSQNQSQGLGGLAMKSTNDLSAKQYYCVIADTSNPGQVVIATANVPIIGVLQNKPKANEIAQVASVRGVTTKVAANAAISKGDKLITATGGYVATATSGAQIIVGIALEAATAQGDIIEMMLVDSYIA